MKSHFRVLIYFMYFLGLAGSWTAISQDQVHSQNKVEPYKEPTEEEQLKIFQNNWKKIIEPELKQKGPSFNPYDVYIINEQNRLKYSLTQNKIGQISDSVKMFNYLYGVYHDVDNISRGKTNPGSALKNEMQKSVPMVVVNSPESIQPSEDQNVVKVKPIDTKVTKLTNQVVEILLHSQNNEQSENFWKLDDPSKIEILKYKTELMKLKYYVSNYENGNINCEFIKIDKEKKMELIQKMSKSVPPLTIEGWNLNKLDAYTIVSDELEGYLFHDESNGVKKWVLVQIDKVTGEYKTTFLNETNESEVKKPILLNPNNNKQLLLGGEKFLMQYKKGENVDAQNAPLLLEAGLFTTGDRIQSSKWLESNAPGLVGLYIPAKVDFAKAAANNKFHVSNVNFNNQTSAIVSSQGAKAESKLEFQRKDQSDKVASKVVRVAVGTSYSGNWKVETNAGVIVKNNYNLSSILVLDHNPDNNKYGMRVGKGKWAADYQIDPDRNSTFGVSYSASNRKLNKNFKYPTYFVFHISPQTKSGTTSGDITFVTFFNR